MPVAIQKHAVNLGLGPTMRDALQSATAAMGPDDIAMVMDADETHDPAVIPDMVAAINGGAGVVVASRYARESSVQDVPLRRLWLSNGASRLFRLLFPTPVMPYGEYVRRNRHSWLLKTGDPRPSWLPKKLAVERARIGVEARCNEPGLFLVSMGE